MKMPTALRTSTDGLASLVLGVQCGCQACTTKHLFEQHLCSDCGSSNLRPQHERWVVQYQSIQELSNDSLVGMGHLVERGQYQGAAAQASPRARPGTGGRQPRLTARLPGAAAPCPAAAARQPPPSSGQGDWPTCLRDAHTSHEGDYMHSQCCHIFTAVQPLFAVAPASMAPCMSAAVRGALIWRRAQETSARMPRGGLACLMATQRLQRASASESCPTASSTAASAWQEAAAGRESPPQ